MTKESIIDQVISEMTKIFAAPNHLRNDFNAKQEALRFYREALSKFDSISIQTGWNQAKEKHTYFSWPPIGNITQACKEASGNQSYAPAKHRDNVLNPFQMAARMAREYTAQILFYSDLAQKAKLEGWDYQLSKWVEAVATLQAQTLCNCLYRSFDAMIIFGSAIMDHKLLDDFLEHHKQQAINSGKIEVMITERVIQRLKNHADAINKK